MKTLRGFSGVEEIEAMEFKLVIEKILAEFEKANVRYALMGGFALGVLGIPRRKYSGS